MWHEYCDEATQIGCPLQDQLVREVSFPEVRFLKNGR
jgi:hypothetical protein